VNGFSEVVLLSFLFRYLPDDDSLLHEELIMRKLMNPLARLLSVVIILSLAVPVLAVPQTRRRRPTTTARRPAGPPAVPVGTQLKIRLEDEIDSKNARTGDRFAATVLNPVRFADARVEGHIAQVKQSGKFKGRTALDLVFDRIVYTDGQSRPFAGQVVRIYGEDSVKDVNEEGTVSGNNRKDSTIKRTGGGAAAGAIIGAIAGGGKGAAIGAAIGAGVGAGSLYIKGSSKVKLERGTEILVRSTR
jgi:hypothetical protein